MKRDMELVRLILQEQEAGETPPELKAYSDEQYFYACEIMEDANLIVVSFDRGGDGKVCGVTIRRLTWAGHDFLDATKNSEIWKLAKEHIIKPGVSWTFQILMEWLKREAQQRFLGGLTSSCDISSPRAV